jgi:cyclase
VLKTRIIPTVLYSGHTLVKSIKFADLRRVGSPLQAIRVYDLREVDELIFLDIAATVEGCIPDTNLIDELADYCFMPLTVGGGIRSVGHVRDLLRVGADKVSVTTEFARRPEVVSEIAKEFGSQCVVVGIDVRSTGEGYNCVVAGGREGTEFSPVSLARMAEEQGAGEILLTSIDQDGMMDGYDIELIDTVSNAVSIPVIVSGGAGKPAHFEAALAAGASALAAASIFHFTETTPRDIKAYLADKGRAVRL